MSSTSTSKYSKPVDQQNGFSLSNAVCSQADYDRALPDLLQAGYTHLAIVRETLADMDTPLSTYHKLANRPFSYLFESVQGGEKWGRYSIIGLPCKKTYQITGSTLTCLDQGKIISSISVEDPLESIRQIQSEYKVADHPGLPEMIGGLVGYFGYETVGYIESKLANQGKSDPIEAPDICLMVSMDVVVFDNLAGRVFMVTLADLTQADAYSAAQDRLSEMLKALGQSFAPPQKRKAPQVAESEFKCHYSRSEYQAAVERCREYIRDGDVMQVVLSQRLSTDYKGEPMDLYRALRTINPSPYMYFLQLGEMEVVGSSPEILVRLQNEEVNVRPIAGTRKRGFDEERDKALEHELLSDEKELAEHLMLIDLGRNDVGRVAEVGSVELSEKMQIERYSHVMHIVSNVRAKIKPEMDAIDVLKATFPAGTVSGAPKVRAMEIINEFEPVKRGVYSGAVGYLGWNGDMDTAIAIRTAVIKNNTVYIQAGAGIVADSKPELEWIETMNKARALISAVNIANSGLEV